MIFDVQNLMFDDTDISGVATTETVSNIIDLKQIGMDQGGPLEIMGLVTATATGAASTYTFAFYVDDDPAMGGEVAILTTPAYALADMVAGTRIPFTMVIPGVTAAFLKKAPQYMRCKVTIGTDECDSCTITMGIVLDAQDGLVASTT